MKKILSFFLFYVIVGIANVCLVRFYLSTTNLPGGQIGMLPVLLFVLGLITTGISLGIGIAFYFLKKEFNYLKAVLVYHLVYFGFAGYETFGAILEDWEDPYVQLNLWMLLISTALLILSILFAIHMDKVSDKALDAQLANK